ncbi:hypothetical protein [Pedobacter sp. SYSU D00535]|uniref:hypothetical protein n=1 Tax=Pedobacter sp. SYSU D00535 TaxID=2810308 RepID=UPI001A96DDB2|nr:hypothetical protein [Pedobacter sp. SYSU D00535]
MAILRTPLPENIRGSVQGLVVIKHRLGKTLITAFPDMSKVVYTEKQKAEQKRFADAVAYARAIISNPEKKAAYQARLPKGRKVFNAAIADYMKGKTALEQEPPGSVLIQLSYAQWPFLLHENQSRAESGLSRKKSGQSRAAFTSNSGPPGRFYLSVRP